MTTPSILVTVSTSLIMVLMALVSGALLARAALADRCTRRYALLIPLAIVGAAGIYAATGSIGTPDAPIANRTAEVAARQKDAADDAQQTRTKLGQARQAALANPDDIQTLFALAEAAANAGDSTTEIATLNHILGLTGEAALHGMIAEALTREAGGIVTLKALEAVERGLAANPHDPRGRYLKGLYLSQNDDDAGALALWGPLAEDLSGTPAFPALTAAIAVSAERLGLDPGAVLPQTPATESPQSPQAAEAEPPQTAGGMSDEDILAMVAGLEARLLNGDTHEARDGWVMLIHSITIIGGEGRLEKVLAHYLSLDLDEADSAVIIAMAETILPPDNLPEAIPPILIELIAKARDLTPNHPSVLFFSGLVARHQGDRAGMVEYWGQLRRQTPDDDPLAALLDAEIAAVQ